MTLVPIWAGAMLKATTKGGPASSDCLSGTWRARFAAVDVTSVMTVEVIIHSLSVVGAQQDHVSDT